jgi:hypothetical protein
MLDGQVACNATFDGMGHLNGRRYLLHDRDAKYCPGAQLLN